MNKAISPKGQWVTGTCIRHMLSDAVTWDWIKQAGVSKLIHLYSCCCCPGVLRRLVEVSDQNDVAQLSFLDPRICPQEIASYPPYDTRTNCYVLVWRRSGKLMLVNCGLWVTDEPNDVSSEWVDHVKPINFTMIRQTVLWPLMSCYRARSKGTMVWISGSILQGGIYPKEIMLIGQWGCLMMLAFFSKIVVADKSWDYVYGIW